MKNNGTFGVYVHLPFCRIKCAYCDFYSRPFNHDQRQHIMEALYSEVAIRQREIRQQGTSLFIGGGTPTVLEAEALTSLINQVRKAFAISSTAEMTIEVNPDSVSQGKIEAIVSAGINRVSIGVQAKQKQLLSILGRRHTLEQVENTVALLHKAGIVNISGDLIYGVPQQSRQDVEVSIQWLVDMGVTHCSLYALQVEEGTPLGRQIENGDQCLPTDDLTVTMMEVATKRLQSMGYVHYEIANYALPGYQCQHNLGYWRNEPYVGLGPAATSYIHNVRYTNVTVEQGYRKQMLGGEPCPQVDQDSALWNIAMAETVFLGLRLLVEGVNKARFKNRFGISLNSAYKGAIEMLVEQGLLVDLPDRLLLTPAAIPIANSVFIHFLPN